MSAISEAFDALSKEERLQLLADLEFEDPMRYASRDEVELRYYCLVYEVQDELGTCYHQGKWSDIAAPVRTVEPTAKEKPSSTTTSGVTRALIAERIKTLKLTITYS